MLLEFLALKTFKEVSEEELDDLNATLPNYKLLTGDYSDFDSVDDLKCRIWSFSTGVRFSMNAQSGQAGNNVSYLNQSLQDYLTGRMGGMQNLDEEIVGEYTGKVKNSLKDGLRDVLVTLVGRATGSNYYVTENMINNLELGISTYNDIMSIPGKVQSFVENVVAAFEAGELR